MPTSFSCMLTVRSAPEARRRLEPWSTPAPARAASARRADELGSYREPPRWPRRSLRRAERQAGAGWHACARPATRDPGRIGRPDGGG
eukprot:5514009-Prymnesium_polylepis.1